VVDNPLWLAPEIIRLDSYSQKADVYAYAIVLCELLATEPLFGELRFYWQIENAILEVSPKSRSVVDFRDLQSELTPNTNREEDLRIQSRLHRRSWSASW